MILNQNQQSDAQLIGDIQNNKVGIDTNNLDFITSLLTTNLYSQPIQSFIRETVANGWDSHVEAGTTDKPVILRIYSDDKSNIHLAVRDYGTGLSPERFNEIYLNIGSSTKRASNQYIGAFGLGRWTMLAVSNVCHLTNYYNGVCTKYIAYKDNVKICIDKIFESSTTEENGLEVEVNTEVKTFASYQLCTKLVEGIKQLTFYNNIYIDDSENILDDFEINRFNNRKIADFKTFKVCDTIGVKDSLLMGNVLYPINNDILRTWFKGISSLPFAIKCDIGDVDITPNREQLLYNQKTIDAINKSCQATLEEVKEICQTSFGCDFKTIDKYYAFMNTDYVHVTLKEFDSDHTIYIGIPKTQLSYYGLSSKITICGKTPPNDLLDLYHKFLWIDIPRNAILYQYYNERFYIKNIRLNINRYIEYFKYKTLYLVNEPLIPIAKRYFSTFKNNHRGTYYFLYKKNIYAAFRRIVKDFCRLYTLTPNNPTIRFIYEDFVANYTNIDTYSIKDVPQSFIDDEKAKTKSNKTSTQQKARKCVIYKLVQGRSYNTVGYETSLTLENLKHHGGTIFFAEKDNPYLEQFYKITTSFSISPKLLLVEVAPSNLPILRELNNAVEFSTVFTTKNNVISKLCTYVYLMEKWNIKEFTIRSADLEDVYLTKFKNVFQAIVYCYNTLFYYGNSKYFDELLKILCVTYLRKGWLNYNMINIIESNIYYVKMNNVLNNTDKYKTLILALSEYVTKNNISNLKRFKSVKETLKPILDEYTPNQKLSHFDVG